MMKYHLFGRSGLRVSELCLGSMTFGEAWKWGGSKEQVERTIDAYLERGGNFIDTANIYTNGESETFIGELLQARREATVLATKYTLARTPGNPNSAGNHRKNLTESLNASLKRLKTDYIDLYWVHAWDEFTPVEETMRALDDAVRAGKILYVGISDAPAWWISQANTIADWKGWTPFVGLQLKYNLIERTIEREFIPMAKALNLAITCWSPLEGGILTGKYRGKAHSEMEGTRYGQFAPESLDRFASERPDRIVDTLLRLAQETGYQPHQLALSWLRQKNVGVPLIPIVGARSPEQMVDNLSILEIELSTEVMAELDRVSSIELGFPHDFLSTVTNIVYGDRLSDIQPRK
jgi:aryl-alcohol dehydrogenase-like predicted oxidoreductase